MKSIVTINGRDLMPHKIIDGKHVVSKTPFFIRSYDDAGNLVDESNVPFGPELFNLLKKRLPAEAARRGEDLTFSGRVTKKRANGLGDTELDEDEALADLLRLYDGRARRWAFDPEYLRAPEIPKQLMDKWFSTLHKLGTAHGSTNVTSSNPNLEVLANEIVDSIHDANTALPDWLQSSQHDEEQQQRRNYMQLMAAMSEAVEPGYTQKMIDSFRQSKNARLRDELAPALDELLGGIAHNISDDGQLSWTRDQEMARRAEMAREYDNWLREIAGTGVSEEKLQDMARDLSVPKSKLLTNILNNSMDFNQLLGDKLEFVDPNPDPEYGPRITDIWAPKAKGLFSSKRKFIPYFEKGNYPVYNFNSDLWNVPNFIGTVHKTLNKSNVGVPKLIKKEAAEAQRAEQNYNDQVGDVLAAINESINKTAHLSPVEQFERMGMDPREWGGASSFGDWQGFSVETNDGDIKPINYFQDVMEMKKRGYYPNLDLSSMLGENFVNVLNRMKRNAKIDKVEAAQERDMVAGKTNIDKWQRMNGKQKRQAYKQHMQNVFEQGLTAETGLDWAGLMADPDKADTVRKQYYKLRDEGTPFNELNTSLSDTVRKLSGVSDTTSTLAPVSKKAAPVVPKDLDSAINEAATGIDTSLANMKASREHSQELLDKAAAQKEAAQEGSKAKKRVVVVKKKKKPESPDELERGGTVDLSDIASVLQDRL